MNKKVNYYQYWGKTYNTESGELDYHLLVYHCLDVAAVGKIWLEQSPAFLKKASVASGLSGKAFVEWFVFFLALHDIGKFDIRFQNLRPDLLQILQGKKTEITYFPRHDQRGFDFWSETVSPFLCSSVFKTDDDAYDMFREWLTIFGALVTGHHGLPPESASINKINEIDKAAVEKFVAALVEVFLSPESYESIMNICKNEELFDSFESTLKKFSWQLAGLTSLCDWIASGDDAFIFCKETQGLEKYFKESCSRAGEALNRAEIIPAKLAEEQGMKQLFPLFADKQTPLQQFCDNTVITGDPQLWILEDVTGAGKTEAALTLASRILASGGGAGCFIALPTMATSNAMYERMAKVYYRLYKKESAPSLSLSHGSRHLSATFSNSYRDILDSLPQTGEVLDEQKDEGRAHCSQWLADSSKKALLSDVGVGTVDQLLLSGLPVRYQSLRAFGMSQKVLIVDEVHAFDAYMLVLLENIITVQAAFGGSVILLSATLPFSVREKFCNAFSDGLGYEPIRLESRTSFPLVTSVTVKNGVREDPVKTRNSVAREVTVEFCEEIEDVFDLIEHSIYEGKCVCWIRNTIVDVTNTFDELQKREVKNLDIFHSRFTLYDRINIENRVLKRFGKDSKQKDRKSQVLVASQVVEQSLDLDFDVLISDLAPIDLLIQRAGRLHRHERGGRGKPVFYVNVPRENDEPNCEWYGEAFPNAKWVYRDTALLWRTKEILKKQKNLRMPDEARLLIESVYGDEEIIKIPHVFYNSEDEAWGKKMADKSQAEFNKLNFELGYNRLASNKWDKDEKVPTRLSDPSNTLYLCRWLNGNITPLYNGEDFAWDLCSLSLRASALKEIEYPKDIMSAIDILKSQKRFMFETIFLVFSGDEMILNGKDDAGRDVTVSYNSQSGLKIKKGGR